MFNGKNFFLFFFNSLQHENAVFSSFNPNNYHHCQFANTTGSSNYQTQNDYPFHQMNGYHRNNLAHQSINANHHHLHHHLHQQTYHLIINNTSTNNIDSNHYHLEPQENAQINYPNLNNNIVLPFQSNELANQQPNKYDAISNENQLNQDNKNYYVQNDAY